MSRLAIALGLALCVAPLGLAQPSAESTIELPFGDVAPRIVDGHVEVVALGLPDARIGSWPARRASARRRAEERARAMLSTWLDERLRGASPSEAARAQAAMREGLAIARVRPLADGAAVVVMRMEVETLRRLFASERAPF